MKKNLIPLVALMLFALASCTSNTKVTEKSDALYRILVGEKYGFIDEKGKIVIEPQFDDAYTQFTEGICFARIGDRRGLIDRNGSFTMEFADTVLYVSDFIKGFSRIDCGYKEVGIINRDKEFIIPASQYDVRVNEDHDSLYFCIEGAKDKNDWYITDTKGAQIGPTCDSILTGFRNGMCAFKKDDKWGYFDRSGAVVIDAIYDFARVFTDDGIARVGKDSKHFYIDNKGNQLLAFEKSYTGLVCNRAIVDIDGEKWLIDKTGKKICPIDADNMGSFKYEDHLATIVKGGHASKIDTMGNVVLSTNFESIAWFEGGVAPYWKDGKVGFIDLSGNVVINAAHEQYIRASHNESSSIRVLQSRENGIWARSYYDLQGNLIWKDTPIKTATLPYRPEKKDFIEYFDAKLAELDPIEGVYYVTIRNYYQDRDNLNSIGTNDTESTFYAIAKNESIDGYMAYLVDGSGKRWVNKFVKIGETNNYAIMKIDKDNDYSSEGRVTIDDPTQFDFRLETGRNNYYNFFVTYEFVKDYPPTSEYEKVLKAEWTGSGFAIADGYIATNYHVTSGAKSIRVKGVRGDLKESYSAYVVASDKEHDISILKIVDKDFDTFGSIPYTIGKSTVDVGDDIFVLGYPMTSTMGEEVKLTEGIISSSTGYKGDDSMYQISAAVQPGNSGGPLFNSDGAVIGIVRGKHAEAENANYAVKVSYLYSLVSSSNLGIDISGSNHINGKSLSSKVKKIKDYVYYIECSSK